MNTKNQSFLNRLMQQKNIGFDEYLTFDIIGSQS